MAGGAKVTRNKKRKETAQAQRAEIAERILPEMVRLANELHGGLYAPCQSEFILYAEGNMPDRTKLSMAFGKWENAVADCGLTLAEPIYYYQKRREREESALWQSQATYPVRDDEMEKAEYVGLGFRVAHSYEAMVSRGGQTFRETRHVLR